MFKISGQSSESRDNVRLGASKAFYPPKPIDCPQGKIKMQLKRDYLDQKVLERLSTLQLHARLPMIGNVSGKHRSPIRGSSLEFAEYRKYVPRAMTRVDWIGGLTHGMTATISKSLRQIRIYGCV